MKSMVVIVMAIFLMSGVMAGIGNFEVREVIELPVENYAGTDTYDLLIITPAKFYDALPAFQQHKEQHGVKTIIVTLEDIYGSKYFPVQGRDDAEKVKYFIKDAYDEWGIKYVLLVGGRKPGLQERWWTPVRYVHLDDKSNWETTYLSDLYFADIYDAEGKFSSWDNNGNGIFGEWKGSSAEDSPIDLFPDVYVGRWPARNALEVEAIVAKTIEYETTAYGAEWFNRFVCIAGDTYPEVLNSSWKGYEGEEGTEQAIEWMPGFEPIRLWTSLGTFTGPDDVINAISEGCGFLFFDGHGSPMSWATHAPNSTEWVDGLTVWQMRKLTNEGMYPVCVVGGCHNSQFNISLFNLLKIWKGVRWYEYIYRGETAPACFSWWMTKKVDGGSVATLGYSGLGYTKEDKNFEGLASEFLDTHFFWEYGMNGTHILGEIWGKAITSYLHTYPINWNSEAGSNSALDTKTVQEWILMGDPSLMIGGYPS